MTTRRERFLLAALILLSVQAAWLSARADATLAYAVHLFSHAGIGLVITVALLAWAVALRRRDVPARAAGIAGAVAIAVSSGFALALAIVASRNDTRWMLTAHGVLAVAGLALLAIHAVARGRSAGSPAFGRVVAVIVAGVAACALLLAYAPEGERPNDRIVNPPLPPMTMADESMGGAAGPFFPSSIHTNTKGRIPSDFFLDSEGCGRSGCHPDITEQWRSSMHHFASFNNQFYRKSIEYMQDVVGVQPSKWCAGCHDVALLLDGKFDRPVAENLALPEAHAGLACVACHSITHVQGSMGQGGYEIEYPPMHELAVSENPVLRGAHDLLLRMDPEPHSKAFLKPFHRKDRAEFCSSCHKVHLDVPVNGYRWMRGFNDYDNWQASGVSGQGARAFYYPEKSSDCVDCHMPLVASKDHGNKAGLVHAHHFAAANTAVPLANGDHAQIERVKNFLKDKVTVDVFALAREAAVAEGALPVKAPSSEPMLSSTFAVGEEGGFAVGSGTLLGGPVDVIAPIDVAGDAAAVRRGESARVDVVVRTRGVGHFFPGGTVDGFDVWVELTADDSNGRRIFWSGAVEDEGKGPVEPGAHMYRSFAIDEHGNHISRRNAWSARSMVYVRLVPPGAADVARFRIEVPADCGDSITLKAKLNYRKFAHSYTQFAYAGRLVDGDPSQVSPDFDDRELRFDADLSQVSGALKEIPDVPIVEISTASATLKVLPADAALPPTPGAGPAEARGRWNDYGIGMLLQGDLRAALHAFETVTRLDPAYPDGFVNIARVRLREGDTQSALKALDSARTLKAGLAREHFFRGLALRSEGRLDESLLELQAARDQHPRDRVVLNEMARVHFLKGEFESALAVGREVLGVDPEDVTAHYTLMLAARGAGDEEASRVHEALYQRFKADDDAPILTGEYRRIHEHDNRERQPIHEHSSVALPWGAAPAAAEAQAARDAEAGQ
jgi:tetratricopeptide (TPR) repeat protein